MDKKLQKLEADILKSIKEDSTKKYDNPLDRLEANSEKSLKYANVLYRLRKKFSSQQMAVRKKYSELYKDLKFHSNWILKSKQDVDSHINSDTDYYNMKSELKEIENLVDLVATVKDIYMSKEYSEREIAKHYKVGD